MGSNCKLLVIAIVSVSCLLSVDALKCPYNVSSNATVNDTSNAPQFCNCTSESVYCRNLDEIPPLISGDDVVSVKSAYFYAGNITSVRNKNLPPGLETLVFYKHPLTDMSDDALQGSGTSLTTLAFIKAGLWRLPNALQQLKNLTTLYISDTFITDWNIPVIQHVAPQLQFLTLQRVGLTEWPEWFSNFHSLESVTILYNDIPSIPDYAFNNTKDTVSQLVISSCNLTHIQKALINLSRLTFVSLSHNNLVKVPLFPNSTETIYLGNNQISDIPLGSLPAYLRSLDLRGNNLSEVPPDIARITIVDSLDLSYNQINTQIHFDMFPEYGVTTVDLSHNQITDITDSVRNSSVFRTILLGSNPVSAISPSAFNCLEILDTLYLDNTNLTAIPAAVTFLPVLRYLNMSDIPVLFCPCPPQKELTTLITNHVRLYGTCNDGTEIAQYLRGASCRASTTAETIVSTTRGSSGGPRASTAGDHVTLFITLTALLGYRL